MNTAIQQLKKVTLDIVLLPQALPAGELRKARLPMYFGIASEGLSGLEMALAGKKVGDRLRFDPVPPPMGEFFGAFLSSLRQSLGGALPGPPFALEVEIVAVEDASHRDLVQAMARSLTHGCSGGDCDCGCGGA